MRENFGIILIDNADIVFRVYCVTNRVPSLLHQHTDTVYELDALSYIEKLAEFFTMEKAQHIETWKICSRHVPLSITKDIARTIGLKIENLSPLREQELICNGMFAELC